MHQVAAVLLLLLVLFASSYGVVLYCPLTLLPTVQPRQVSVEQQRRHRHHLWEVPCVCSGASDAIVPLIGMPAVVDLRHQLLIVWVTRLWFARQPVHCYEANLDRWNRSLKSSLGRRLEEQL